MDAKLKTDQGRAIVEGKTAIPFKTFVGLILQRKVFNLFKTWGKEPIIVDSELLTDLASAPQDNQENKEQLVRVSMGTGVIAGVFVLSVTQAVLLIFDQVLWQEDHLILSGSLFGLAVLAYLLSKTKKKGRGQKMTDAMEKVAGMVSK